MASEADVVCPEPSPCQYSLLIGGHTCNIQGVVYSNDGKYIVSCGNDSKICIWDAKTKKLIKIIEVRDEDNLKFELRKVLISNDNKLIIAFSGGGYIFIFDMDTGEKINQIIFDKEHYNLVYLIPGDLRSSPKFENYLLVGQENTCVILNPYTGKTQGHFPAVIKGITHAISPDGNKLALTDEKFVYIYDISLGGKIVETIDLWETTSITYCHSLEFSNDSTAIIFINHLSLTIYKLATSSSLGFVKHKINKSILGGGYLARMVFDQVIFSKDDKQLIMVLCNHTYVSFKGFVIINLEPDTAIISRVILAKYKNFNNPIIQCLSTSGDEIVINSIESCRHGKECVGDDRIFIWKWKQPPSLRCLATRAVYQSISEGKTTLNEDDKVAFSMALSTNFSS